MSGVILDSIEGALEELDRNSVEIRKMQAEQVGSELDRIFEACSDRVAKAEAHLVSETKPKPKKVPK